MREARQVGLIIDDDHAIHQTYKAILAKLPVKFESVYDGRAGLDKIISSTYDVILLDLNMPEMNGIELLEEANAAGLHLPPTVVCSSVNDKVFIMGALALGASGYLVKPVDIQKLRAAVSEYIGFISDEMPAELPAVPYSYESPAVKEKSTPPSPVTRKDILGNGNEKFTSVSRAMGHMVFHKKTATLKVITMEGIGLLSYVKGNLKTVTYNSLTGIDALERMKMAVLKSITIE
jgi:CheY-like chemotaxis protein